MFCCTDVAYTDTRAVASGLVFENWDSAVALEAVSVRIPTVAPYRSGHFFERELPCLLKLFESLPYPVDCLIVDGFVWLGPGRPGLGCYLYEALNGKVPVVGVAKNSFQGNSLAAPVQRGGSRKELWVTSQGIDLQEAVDGVRAMDGAYRNPTLLKAVDRACRDGLADWSTPG